MKDRELEIEARLKAATPCLIPVSLGVSCHESLNRSGICQCQVAYLLAEVKRLREVVEAAKRWAGNNLPQEGECGNSDANILRRALREHAAALSAMGEP